MDAFQLSRLRLSTKERLTIDMATPRHMKRCCQTVYEEAIERGVNLVLEELDKGELPTHASSLCADNIIEEQDESDGDTTMVSDKSSIAAAFSSEPELWRKCKSFPIAFARHKGELASLDLFNTKMTWLDEILATAKAEFGLPEGDLLPKTPAIKRTRKKKVVRKSSLPVTPDTIVKPVRRTRRAAAMEARSRIESSSGVNDNSPKLKKNGRLNSKSRKGSADTDAVASSSKTAQRTATSEGKSVPKKIARFSRLPHVKDKVDAFEKISDGTHTVNSTSTPTNRSTLPNPPTFTGDMTASRLPPSPMSQPDLTVITPDSNDTVTTHTPATVKKRAELEEAATQPTDGAVHGSGNSLPSQRASRSRSQWSRQISTESHESVEAVSEGKVTDEVNVKEGRCSRYSDSQSTAKNAGKATRENVAKSKASLSDEGTGVVATSLATGTAPMEDVRIEFSTGESTDMSSQEGVDLEDNLDSSVFVSPTPLNEESEKVKPPERTNAKEKKVVEEVKSSATPGAVVEKKSAAPGAHPQRMTRSKMRAPRLEPAADPGVVKAAKKTSPVRAKTPPRTQSPARTTARTASANDRTRAASANERTRVASADRADSAMKKKAYTGSKPKLSRTSSESSMYNSSSVVRTLTKAASYSRLNKNPNTSMSKQHTISTPDMSRSQSVVKSFLKGSSSRTSPQHTPSLGRTVISFLSRATPQKTVSKEEQAEKKQQQLREKQDQERHRLEEAEKLRIQRVDAKKRERAEKMKRAQEARQAKLDEIKSKQQEMEKKSQQKNEICTQALEKKQKEERQRAVLREQKVREAEERRRKEEEKRQVKLKASEQEQKRNADKKKEAEEMERQRKMQEAENLKEQKLKLMTKVKEDRLANQQSAAAKSSKPSIYEMLSSKTAALSEDRKALIAASSRAVDESSQKLNSTFTKEDREPGYIDPDILDENDEFEDPKFAKCVAPSWVRGHQMNMAVVNQYDDSLNGFKRAHEILGLFKNYTPDLTKLFKEHKPSFFKRTSSAQWHSPPMKQQRSGK